MRLLLLALLLAAAAATAQPLPPEVDAALARARLPRESVSLLVTEVDPARPPRLAHRAQMPVNPASLSKLVTTSAALDLLGPAWTWTTQVLADRQPDATGTVQGNLYLRGSGDPKLVTERLWLLLRRLRALGIDRVTGDIVLDQSAFESVAADPGAFDGEPLRPYNAQPEALLLNFKSVLLTLVPQPGGSARVVAEPPLAGVQWPPSVPLAAGECGDWRAGLRLETADVQRPRFTGSYPSACGERTWPLAFPEPASYARRLVAAQWQEVGGRLDGQVRDGRAPGTAVVLASAESPALAEVVRDINKYSNNVMAQQLFLSLGLARSGAGTREASREVLRGWWRERFGPELPLFDNGSGLSREERISAAQLGRLLQHAWASPWMPELAASLPALGADGTLRRIRGPVAAHMKTGSLRDVWGVAGWVHAPGGRRLVVVAIANHPNAAGLRSALDPLLAWAVKETP